MSSYRKGAYVGEQLTCITVGELRVLVAKTVRISEIYQPNLSQELIVSRCG
jgi:hypothetical protein